MYPTAQQPIHTQKSIACHVFIDLFLAYPSSSMQVSPPIITQPLQAVIDLAIQAAPEEILAELPTATTQPTAALMQGSHMAHHQACSLRNWQEYPSWGGR